MELKPGFRARGLQPCPQGAFPLLWLWPLKSALGTRFGGWGWQSFNKMAYTGRLRLKGVSFSVQEYERVGISLVEVYKRGGEYFIWVCERAQINGLVDEFQDFMKLRKHAVFVIDSYFKDSALTALKNERGNICQQKVYEIGIFFVKNGI